MSYNIYFTRSDEYFDDSSPITLKEVEELQEKLPRNFYFDYSGIVTTTTPDGKTISAEVGPYLYYLNENDLNSKICIYFYSGCPFFSVRDEKKMLPLLELADLLQAKLQGEELEVYTEDSILNINDNFESNDTTTSNNNQNDKKGFFKKLFKK
ncbi:hypothetical protein [Breznakia pachnodae]|uniref:Uncharacterized protein n=1 Tax=Breznakia pachnodae TaxID=265178 RepID=A0ABU0DY38_9FIRM|nr:hypothetical protein [Breznakia pachnodae]MDQ0359486.1 hypothetical protein [Breznakia pachnodae]